MTLPDIISKQVKILLRLSK